jgi:DNA-binding HxlR family transcriptional regulator
VARALDLIGERWTLVLVRHLLGGPRGFQELRERSGIAPRMLATRLRQLAERGLVEDVAVGSRSLYGLTERGRTLEPLVRSIARWWVENAMEATAPFSDTAAASVVEALPFLLRDDRAKGISITYEIRLTGPGGGVWTVEIDDGTCRVRQGFAERADVRYTAEARDWCRVAIGLEDDRAAVRAGRLVKDGAGGSLAWYFHQVRHPAHDEEQDDDRV